MKKLIAATVLMAALAGIGSAQTDATGNTTASSGIVLSPAGVALSDTFKATSAGLLLTTGGKTLATAYAPLWTWTTPIPVITAVSLDAGAVMNVENAQGSPFGALDATIVDASVALPFKLGAGATWYAPTHEWLFGVHLAVKL